MQQGSSFIFIVAILAVFYFLIIRPQQQRQKAHAELVSRLEPGAEILTIGGLYGTIAAIDGDRVRIVVADGSEMEFARNAIAQLIEPSAEDTDDAAEDAGEAADDADAASPADQPADADV